MIIRRCRPFCVQVDESSLSQPLNLVHECLGICLEAWMHTSVEARVRLPRGLS